MARTASNVICAAVLVLACLLPFCLATAEADAWTAKYKKLSHMVVTENRALVQGADNAQHGRDLLNLDDVRFCAIPADQEVVLDPNTGYPSCDALTYGKALAIIALPGVILAGLSLVGCVLYTFCLCCSCCKCCCCGCARKEAKAINKCKNLIIILFTAVAVAIVAVGFAITITGNQQTSVGVTELTNVVVDALDTVIERIDVIADKIQNLTGIPKNVNDIIQGAQDTLTRYKSDSAEVVAFIEKIDQARLAVILVASIVAVVIVGLGFIACFCRKGRKFLMTMSVLAFLSSFVIWVSLAVHLVVVEVMHDMCDEINRMEENEANSNASASINNPLGYLIKCRDNDTNMAELFGAVDAGKQFVVNETCSFIVDSCSQEQIQCSGDYASCNATNIFGLPNTIYITDRTFSCISKGVPATVNLPSDCDVPPINVNYEANVTIADCATSCRNEYLRNQTSNAVNMLDTIQAYFSALDDIEAALNCRFVYDAFQSGKTAVCTTFIDAFSFIALGDALMGGGTAMAIILFTFKFITM